MGRLDGKVAVVTGGANGIGLACCQRFAEEGASVVVADLLPDAAADACEAVAKVADGAQALAVSLDAADAEGNDEMIRQAVNAFGGVDIVVTAAGISHARYRSGDLDADLERLSGPLLHDPARRFVLGSMDDWDRVLAVNLTGTYFAVRAAARQMIDQARGGSIITIASVAAKHPEAGPVAYSVSKAGVWMLTKQAARALGPAGIRVNAIGPGYIDTSMTAVLKHLGRFDSAVSELPLRRAGVPRDVANTALFLASEESSYFTGELLHPDGGYYTD